MRPVLLALVAALVLPAVGPTEEKPARKAPDVPAGLHPEEVRARLGAPSRISRQVFAHRALEQWHYSPPHEQRLEFDCPRGQVPRLVRTLRGRAP